MGEGSLWGGSNSLGGSSRLGGSNAWGGSNTWGGSSSWGGAGGGGGEADVVHKAGGSAGVLRSIDSSLRKHAAVLQAKFQGRAHARGELWVCKEGGDVNMVVPEAIRGYHTRKVRFRPASCSISATSLSSSTATCRML